MLLTLLYFALRLPNLTLQPIFADEAIYVRWAQVMRSEPTLRFLPLSDGKTPLFMWAMMPMFKVFEDPLFAGRFLSIISGFFTMLGVFALGWKVFHIRVGLLSALVYTVVPYTVFFDRMALVDSMLAAFTVWIIFFAIWLARSLRLDLSMILGYLMGGALLTKTPAMTNLLLLPISYLAFRRKSKYSLLKLVGFWAVAILIAMFVYNILRLGPEFYQLSARNADYVFSPLELKGRPLDPFIPHFKDIADWFPKLLTIPILFLAITGSVLVILKKEKLGIIILLWAIIPLMIQMAFLKTFTARYLLSSIPPLLVLAGFGLDQILGKIKERNIKIGLGILLILPLALHFNYLLLTDPQKAPLPEAERRGYLEDWTAGYGFPDIAQFFLEQSKNQSVVVGTEGYFGTLPDGLQIYLDKSGVVVIGGSATVSAQLRNAAKDNLTFFVTNKSRFPNDFSNIELIREYPKAKSLDGLTQDAIMIFRVYPLE